MAEAEIRVEAVNPLGTEVFLFLEHGGHWAPQPHAFRLDPEGYWESKMYLSGSGRYRAYVVKANPLGVAFVRYYEKVVRTNRERRDAVERALANLDESTRCTIGAAIGKHGDYQGIELPGLPKGLDEEANVEFFVG
jgi:hypothetical protein